MRKQAELLYGALHRAVPKVPGGRALRMGVVLIGVSRGATALGQKLAGMAGQGNWFAGRFYYQLEDAVNQLDELDPWAPDIPGLWPELGDQPPESS